MKQIKLKLKDLRITLTKPYQSKELSSDKMNLWELHEADQDQEITITIKR